MSEPLSPSLALTLAFSAALLIGLAVKLWLASRQIRHVATHRHQVPQAFASKISLEAHQKAADYTIAKSRVGLVDLAFGTALTLAWTLLGGLQWLQTEVSPWFSSSLLQQLALLLCFAAISGLLDLPLSWYQTFVIEQRFGFNKMTLSMWWVDLGKSLLLGVIIGTPLAALILWLMASAGALWWLWTWGVWVVFQLLLLMIYPSFIAPLFNQFSPLEDESLKTRVNALMQRCGFQSKGFFVMDGSRRSAHANAYFTGFGASKRVVFFDTLLAQLSPSEVEAVLAHELGHFHHKHIVKRIFTLWGTSLAGFALLGWLSSQSWFYTGLGVQPNLTGGNEAVALILFMFVVPTFTFFVSPMLAYLSRRDEFQADAYAGTHSNASDLSSALLKLYQDNASTLTPDPVFVSFYYSHPPASERLARMAAGQGAPA